jgi:hypothetical protein
MYSTTRLRGGLVRSHGRRVSQRIRRRKLDMVQEEEAWTNSR